MNRVATRIFLAFAVSLAAFAAVAVFSVGRLQELRRDLRLLTNGYLPLTRVASEIEVKDWVASRALEARGLDRAAREAYLPVARAHFPALVRERLEEGKQLAAQAAPYARGADARFLSDVRTRLEGLSTRWAEYDKEARALFDAILAGEGGDPKSADEFEARVARVRLLEKGLSLDVKLLQVALESQVNDRIHATEQTESTTGLFIVLYSSIALAVGLGAALISQRLLAPIERLTEGVKAVAKGDLSRKVEVRRTDEMASSPASSTPWPPRSTGNGPSYGAPSGSRPWGASPPRSPCDRNPLNAIGLNAELLAEESPSWTSRAWPHSSSPPSPARWTA